MPIPGSYEYPTPPVGTPPPTTPPGTGGGGGGWGGDGSGWLSFLSGLFGGTGGGRLGPLFQGYLDRHPRSGGAGGWGGGDPWAADGAYAKMTGLSAEDLARIKAMIPATAPDLRYHLRDDGPMRPRPDATAQPWPPGSAGGGDGGGATPWWENINNSRQAGAAAAEAAVVPEGSRRRWGMGSGTIAGSAGAGSPGAGTGSSTPATASAPTSWLASLLAGWGR